MSSLASMVLRALGASPFQLRSLLSLPVEARAPPSTTHSRSSPKDLPMVFSGIYALVRSWWRWRESNPRPNNYPCDRITAMWWDAVESNHASPKTADLQSAPAPIW